MNTGKKILLAVLLTAAVFAIVGAIALGLAALVSMAPIYTAVVLLSCVFIAAAAFLFFEILP